VELAGQADQMDRFITVLKKLFLEFILKVVKPIFAEFSYSSFMKNRLSLELLM